MSVLGIDPGAKGCAVVLASGGPVGHGSPIEIFRFEKMTESEIGQALCKEAPRVSLIAIEKVGAMPGQGRSAMFTFGGSWGFVRGAVYSNPERAPISEPTPNTWQRDLRIPKVKDESKTARKRKLREVAERLFPSVRMTNDVADALLIAAWAMTIELPKLRGESA